MNPKIRVRFIGNIQHDRTAYVYAEDELVGVIKGEFRTDYTLPDKQKVIRCLGDDQTQAFIYYDEIVEEYEFFPYERT